MKGGQKEKADYLVRSKSSLQKQSLKFVATSLLEMRVCWNDGSPQAATSAGVLVKISLNTYHCTEHTQKSVLQAVELPALWTHPRKTEKNKSLPCWSQCPNFFGEHAWIFLDLARSQLINRWYPLVGDADFGSMFHLFQIVSASKTLFLQYQMALCSYFLFTLERILLLSMMEGNWGLKGRC